MNTKAMFFKLTILVGSLMVLSGCIKSTDAVIAPSMPIRYEDKELTGALAAESNLTIFNQAFNRLSLAGQLDANTGYTIFAPTDSAFNAAGITAQAISSMSASDLRRLITMHIAIGAVDKASLENAVTGISLNTLNKDTIPTANNGTTIRNNQIFARISGSVYLNGDAKGISKTIIKASNGYIYPIGGIVKPFNGRTLLQVIKSDPDLSLYYESLLIGDSVRQAGLGYNDKLITDVYTFDNVSSFNPTVFAPTNKAFNDAGFHNADDIRNFATSGYVGYDLETFTYFIYSKLDSVIKRHVLYTRYDLAANVRVFYSDLLNPSVNNGKYNTYFGPGGPLNDYELKFSEPLLFSKNGSDAYVKWTDDPAEPLYRIPHNATGSQPVNSLNLLNGTLIKVDKLFYPAAK